MRNLFAGTDIAQRGGLEHARRDDLLDAHGGRGRVVVDQVQEGQQVADGAAVRAGEHEGVGRDLRGGPGRWRDCLANTKPKLHVML